MNRLHVLLAAAIAAGSVAPATAMPSNVPPPLAFDIVVDTAPILNVSVATHQFTSMGTLDGGHYALIQSTDATSNFCCSYEVGASTAGVAGQKGCIRAKKEAGGSFYELEMRAWARDLVLKCQTFATTAAKTLTILQGR